MSVANTSALAGRPTINATLPPYNADPLGLVDSQPALVAAQAALPPGGAIWLPTGNYMLMTGFTISKPGIEVIGPLPAGWSTATGGSLARLFAGAAMANLARVSITANTIQGAGFRNLILDGTANVTGPTLFVSSSQHGRFRDLSVLGAGGQYAIQTIAKSGAGRSNAHNWYKKIAVTPGTTTGSGGVQITATDGTANCNNEAWDDLAILWASAGAGVTITGIDLAGCDNVRLRSTHFFGVAPVGANVGVQFDYSINAGWPADCLFDGVDFGGAGVTFANVGVPTATAPNRIVGISKTNGQPANPALASLSWGYTAANP